MIVLYIAKAYGHNYFLKGTMAKQTVYTSTLVYYFLFIVLLGNH